MKAAFAFAVAVVALGTTVFADQFLCVPDKSTGFKFDAKTKSWDYARFTVSEDKYLIAQASEPKANPAYTITKLGQKFPMATCVTGFNESGYLLCGGFGADFKFNRKNGRFLHVSYSGYFNVLPEVNKITDDDSDTPYIEIGKCSPF